MSAMYPSLQAPWSAVLSDAEKKYKDAGLVKTKAPPRAKSRMSSGATALCKHFERGGSSSERGVAHPFWPLPKGSNDNKNQSATQILQTMLDEASWRNVMMLHQGLAVYEIRNNLGYGMRWTLEVERQDRSEEAKAPETNEEGSEKQISKDEANSEHEWRVTKTIFRGFLEPIEGMDHELPVAPTEGSTTITA